MPWQSLVADVALEIDPDSGRLAYDEVRITVPRQSGKSTWVLAKAVHRASATGFFGPRQKIVYTAQTRLKAREKWEEDYLAELETSREWRNKIHPSLANGHEHIRFANKSRFGIESNTEKAGHGSTLDEAYIDEAFAQPDGRLEQAFSPAMITRPNKQLVIVSTAGWLDASPYLWAKVEHGRQLIESGQPSRVAYFEWSAPQEADPFDRSVWWECMPALGITITEDAIAAELERMMASPEGLNGFRRAYLNQWVPKFVDKAETDVIPAWSGCGSEPDRIVTPPAISVDVALDRSFTSIAVAGQRGDGKTQVELVEYKPGTGWAVERLAQMHRTWGVPVTFAAKGPAGSLQPDLEAIGVPVNPLGSADVVKACGDIYDAASEGRLAHLNDPVLDTAVRSARLRSGESFVFMRKSDTDISPLYAVALAHWAASTTADITQAVW